MKKIACLLVLLLCLHCAFAEGVPEDGLYHIGVSSNAKMFVITDCTLRVEEGKLIAVMTMSGSGYGYLYQGTSEEADAAPVESWTPYFANSEGKHRFAIEIPCLDQDIAMASWSIRYEKWYDRTLHFFSDTLTPYCEIVPDGVYCACVSSDTIMDGMPCLLYSKEGKMRLELDMGEDMSLMIDGNVGEYADGVASVPLESLDMRYPLSFDLESGWMKIESLNIEPFAVTAEDGAYSVEVKTDSGLLKFTDCRLKIDNGRMTALLTAKNNSFDYLYLGAAVDANADPDNWIPAIPNVEGNYTYEVSVESLDNTLRVATYSAKKKLWYDREITFDSQTLTVLE